MQHEPINSWSYDKDVALIGNISANEYAYQFAGLEVDGGIRVGQMWEEIRIEKSIQNLNLFHPKVDYFRGQLYIPYRDSADKLASRKTLITENLGFKYEIGKAKNITREKYLTDDYYYYYGRPNRILPVAQSSSSLSPYDIASLGAGYA